MLRRSRCRHGTASPVVRRRLRRASKHRRSSPNGCAACLSQRGRPDAATGPRRVHRSLWRSSPAVDRVLARCRERRLSGRGVPSARDRRVAAARSALPGKTRRPSAQSSAPSSLGRTTLDALLVLVQTSTRARGLRLLLVPRRSSAATPWSPLSAQLVKAWTDRVNAGGRSRPRGGVELAESR